MPACFKRFPLLIDTAQDAVNRSLRLLALNLAASAATSLRISSHLLLMDLLNHSPGTDIPDVMASQSAVNFWPQRFPVLPDIDGSHRNQANYSPEWG